MLMLGRLFGIIRIETVEFNGRQFGLASGQETTVISINSLIGISK